MEHEPKGVVYHSPTPDRGVAGSQLGLGQSIPTPDGHEATVTNIESVWRGDKNVGWVYTDQNHEQYYQQNRAVDPSSSWSVGVAKFVEVGQSSPTGPGAIQPLDSHKTLAEQLPHGAQVLQGFDPHLKASAQDGRTAFLSPMSVGDEIPDGKGGHTAITVANGIERNGMNVGWAYQGADGHAYFQTRSDTEVQTNLGGGAGIVSAGVGPPGISGVHRFQMGDIQPGDRFQKLDQHSPTVQMGYDPEKAVTLPNGGKLTGKIVAVTDDHVIQNAGRGSVAVYDRSALPPHVEPGMVATIANNNGNLAFQPQTPVHDRGLTRA